jgi:hypothetical protein
MQQLLLVRPSKQSHEVHAASAVLMLQDPAQSTSIMQLHSSENSTTLGHSYAAGNIQYDWLVSE